MNRLLQSVIARLPPKLREPLVLSTLEEMSTLDIAATLGTSESGGTFASVSRASNSARKIGSLAGRKTWILKGPNSTTIGLMRRSRSTVQPSHEPDWRAEFWPICPGNVKI